jgi:hypothetical protein
MKDGAPLLQVTACCTPHFRELQLQESSCAHKMLGSTFRHKIGSIREMEEMVRTKSAHLPEPNYSALWLSAHGSAYFHVWKPCGVGWLVCWNLTAGPRPGELQRGNIRRLRWSAAYHCSTRVVSVFLMVLSIIFLNLLGSWFANQKKKKLFDIFGVISPSSQ